MLRSVLASAALIAGLSASAIADSGTTPLFPSPNLPPLGGSYVGQFHSWGGGLFNLSSPVHSAFTDSMPPPPPSGTQVHTFFSTVSGTISGPSLPATFVSIPGVATTVRVTHVGDMGSTRIFDTEILSLNLSSGGLMIRESPTLSSPGATSITEAGGGMYHIDSFFDVFTELSVDGGQSWIPSDGPTRMKLIPAPGAIALTGAGLLVGAARRRRG